MTDTYEPKATKKRKVNMLTRQAPNHDLQTTIGLLQKVYESLGEGPFGRKEMLEALGHKADSGSAGTKIGSLTHFALAKSVQGSYRISEVARAILLPHDEVEKKEAVARAAGTPALYGKLIQTYGGRSLPPMLSNILAREYDSPQPAAAEVVNLFRKTVEFAGLLHNGVLSPALGDQTSPQEMGEGREQGAQHEGKPFVQPPSHPQQMPEGTRSFNVPVSGNLSATLLLPIGIGQEDLERIKKWIDLMADVLTEPDEEAAASGD